MKKLINESISNTFTRGEDKLSNMGIGKIQLIKDWLKDNDISNYKINADYSIDVYGRISRYNKNIGDFPSYIQFNIIDGSFLFGGNHFTTLRGFPREIYGLFDVSGAENTFVSLEDAPIWVTDSVNIYRFSDQMDTKKQMIVPASEIKKYLRRCTIGGKFYCDISKYNSKYVVDINLYESSNQTFTRNNIDKLSSLGIGKIDMIKAWLEKYEIGNYTINDDLTIDTTGNLNLAYSGIEKFPEYIKFRTINGDFSVKGNGMTSLRGCPEYVRDNFNCSNNKLTSLEFAPITGGSTWYNLNQISNGEIDKYIERNNWHNKNRI